MFIKTIKSSPFSECCILSTIQTRFLFGKLGSDFSGLVRATGLEPVRCHHRGILSPLRLPISPRPHINNDRRRLFRRLLLYCIIRCLSTNLCFSRFHSERVVVMVRLFEHHILDLHQARCCAALVFVELHRDILYRLLILRDHNMLKGVDSAARFSISPASNWHDFSISASLSISGIISDSALTALSSSAEVNAVPYE